MSRPRRITLGTTWLVTRRIAGRAFFLVPKGRVKEILGYCIALAAQKHGIIVHDLVVLSNHWHATLTDPKGRISAFLRDVHAWVAKCINTMLGRAENVWSSDKPSLVKLVTPADVLAKAVYVVCNAVKAGLVAKPSDWPGLRTLPGDVLRKARRFRRPKLFFVEDGVCPDEVELKVEVPPCFAELGPKAYAAKLAAAVDEEVAALAAQRGAEGKKVLGVSAVKRQPRHATPATPAPRRRLDPEVACLDPERRKLELRLLVLFREEYRKARQAWMAGDLDVVFPFGTYLMARIPGVRIGRPPDGLAAAA